ncbi:hypothetical protein D3C71_2077450 [compost metagenome]
MIYKAAIFQQQQRRVRQRRELIGARLAVLAIAQAENYSGGLVERIRDIREKFRRGLGIGPGADNRASLASLF